MRKLEVVAHLASETGLSHAAAGRALDAMLSAIGEALARDEAVAIAGFGRFSRRSRAARTGRNPRTGESVAIAASNTPVFRAGKALRDAVS